IAGLQDIWPMWSRLSVSISVRTPIRAAASAASMPAWPAPTTITPKFIRTVNYCAPGRFGQGRARRALSPTISRISLLSDAELAKHRVEHVLHADLAGNRAERLGRRGGIDRHDLRRHSGQRRVPCIFDGSQSLRERIAMALARDRDAVR